MELLSHDDDSFREASGDQRELVRLVRGLRSELHKRLPDIGCMSPSEIGNFLDSVDMLIDLHVYAHSVDERLEYTKQKMQRHVWSD
jgi:hypothetical protein